MTYRSFLQHDFDPAYFGNAQDLCDGSDATECDTIMIACSDHGSAPDNVSLARPGRMFILQRLAASIPSFADCEGLGIEDICIGLDRHNIKQIVTCGHLGCGVIRNWMKTEQPISDTGNLRRRFLEGTFAEVEQTGKHLAQDELTACLIHEHVLMQIANLLTHEVIKERLQSGSLRLHGWVIDEQTARVFAYDPNSGVFAKL